MGSRGWRPDHIRQSYDKMNMSIHEVTSQDTER